MTNVYLYGHLGRKFGWRWTLDVSSPAEAVRALIANRPEFQAHMIRHSRPGFQVIVGADPLRDEIGLHYPVGRQAIKIVPVVAGAEKSPVIGIIIGAVIVAAAIVAGPAGFGLIGTSSALLVGGIGVSLAIGGISQLMAGSPHAPEPSERPENKPSTLFSGPVNTTAQGHPVPIGYGRLRVGSAVISAGIRAVAEL